MKKICFLLAFIAITTFAKAQETQNGAQKKQENIEALKVAFLSKELVLTPDEAQKFWPLYDQYSKELKLLKNDNTDVLERDEKVLNLRKKYKDQFAKILGNQRANDMYKAESKFHLLLIKAMKKQN